MKAVEQSQLWVILLSLLALSSAHAQQSGKDFHIALVGDTNWHRRISVNDDPACLKLIESIRAADARFANFEDLIHPLSLSTAPGGYSYAPPYIVDEIKWAGFNILSVANNHAFDYGTEGFLDSLHALDAAGLIHAGGGDNLAFARAPAYLDTRHGRVALIACASTFRDGSQAGEQRPDLRGRPGIDPLRYAATYLVDESTFASLKKLAALNASGGEGNGTSSSGSTMSFLGSRFKIGTAPALTREINEQDLQGIVASIRNARRQANWVVVSIHSHEGAAGNRELPPDFLVKFAHAAIDAGADVFVGHGPLILKGIEIYKGKPIFYSLGNFVFDGESGVPFFGAESYDSVRLPWNALPADFRDATLKNDGAKDTAGFPADKLVWQSAVAQVTFDADHRLTSIELEPITLGFGNPRPDRGHPMPASPADAESIIHRVALLSADLGTKVDFVNGKGVVEVKTQNQ